MSERLTTDQGQPDNDNLIEQLMQSRRERIPKRDVHARGAGARGVFVTEQSMAAYTKAHFLQTAGQETPLFARFSTVFHGKGSPETVRDPRAFEVKLHTQEGICDIVGSHLPVAFVRDAAKYSELVQAMKSSPDTNEQTPSRYWDLLTMAPESTHMLTWLFANDGTPANYRQMDGYSVHTFKWMNAEGNITFVKYRWKSKQGTAYFTPDEAAAMQSRDFSHATRDLYAAIENGEFPQWELYAQLLTPDGADKLLFDPLDPTKRWPEELGQYVKVGTMTLNLNPINYYGEVERSIYSPSALVPGIELAEGSARQQYEAVEQEQEPLTMIDDFTQAGERCRSLPENEQEWLVHNLVSELKQVPQQTQLRAVCNFYRADERIGMRLAAGLGIDLGRDN
ncbi:catalase-related immune-responsive protein [Paenibacillus cellulosilyticus]|uniref:catalase n=1 Tax=Paenibacillus cellulosilyticus TaxID=375489 RepID=A0A2V2YZR8_9BACL|nr:catalase [Paenibacillus cellulosilyticus]PWW08513.1 catalase-related immune-responsive protein [Paenibacillus cellulosilyticus]QKS48093.1 catalase [Paenibacillus cellulosilyticus]